MFEESAFTNEELNQYEKFWDIISVEKTLYSNGEHKGREEGGAEGRMEGLQEAAAKMKQRGMHIKDIAACTGLDESVVRTL